MLRLDGLSLICIIPVYLQYMASYASKPLYIDRVTYISNVSITKGNLYCATYPAQLSNVPSPIVQRSQPYWQRVKPHCATCATLPFNVPNSTVQRTQLYCQSCPYLLSNAPSQTMQIIPPLCATCATLLCNMSKSTMQRAQLYYMQRAQTYCPYANTYCATCQSLLCTHSIINLNTIY